MSLNDKLIEKIENYMPLEAIKLLKNAANPNSKDSLGDTCVQLAVSYINQSSDEKVDHESHEQSGKLLLELAKCGAKLNLKSHEGIWFSEELFRTKIRFPYLQKLIEEYGLDIKKGNVLKYFFNSDKTAVHMINSFELLLNNGLIIAPEQIGVALTSYYPDYNNMFGIYKLDSEFVDVIRYLKGVGVNLNAQHRNGHTILMGAVLARSIHVVQLLIELDADLNIKTDKGWTALMFASGEIYKNPSWKPTEESNKILKLLLEAGADPILKSNTNKTALSLATKSRNKTGQRLLSTYAL